LNSPDAHSPFIFASTEIYIPKIDWYFNLSTDYGTIEVQTQPSILDELKNKEITIQIIILDRILENGFTANTKMGNGHFNAGVESVFPGLDKDPKALWAFFSLFLDFHSHTELSSGIWGKSYFNAPPFVRSSKRELLQKRIRGIQDLQKDFLNGRIHSYQQLRKKIKYQLKYHPFCEKFEALRLPKDMQDTLEYRAVVAQQDFNQFVLMAELFELRFRYLQKLGFPLDFYMVSDRISDQEKLDRYYLFVTESGGDWKKFSRLISPNFPKLSPSSILSKSRDKWTHNEYLVLKKYENLRYQFPYIDKLWKDVFGSARSDTKCASKLTH
jgi:hypothetical protein